MSLILITDASSQLIILSTRITTVDFAHYYTINIILVMTKVMNTQTVRNNCWCDMTCHLETNYEDITTEYRDYVIEGSLLCLCWHI